MAEEQFLIALLNHPSMEGQAENAAMVFCRGLVAGMRCGAPLRHYHRGEGVDLRWRVVGKEAFSAEDPARIRSAQETE